MKLYKFNGKNTHGTRKYYADGNTAIELYQDLVNQNIISICDGDPYEMALLKKNSLTIGDFMNEDDDLDNEKYNDFLSDNSLEDAEIIQLIKKQDGNAYYQTIEMWNGEGYEEI